MSDFDITQFGPCNCTIWKDWRKGITVPHWRSLVETKYLSHFELQGRPVVVVIRKIDYGEVTGKGGKTNKKAIVYFEGKEKGMVMGVACLSACANMYGDDYTGWIGKPITIYPTTTQASGGEIVGTIRVKPSAPPMPGRGKQAPKDPPAGEAAS